MASSLTKPEPDPALKAQLASLVARLTTELGVGGGRSAEGLATASVAMLSKMISPYDVTKVSVQQSHKTLSATAPDPEAFAAHYARLKAMHVREVDKYLAVVAKIASDPDLLAAVTVPRPANSPLASASRSTYALSENDAETTVPGADVSSLPLDGFSFQTNPLASEEKSTVIQSPGSRGMRRLGDDLGGEDLRLDDDRHAERAARALRNRARVMDINGGARGSPRESPNDPDPDRDRDADADDSGKTLVEGVDFPKLPAWIETRPYLNGAHLGARFDPDTQARARVVPGKPLRDYSVACQELLILDDLLYAMLGVDGRFVVATRSSASPSSSSAAPSPSPSNSDSNSHAAPRAAAAFVLADGLDGSLRAFARETLPLCAAAATVAAYAEAQRRFEGGFVSHALAAEMEELLHDWRVMVVQLEHQRNLGKLSLQSLLFYVRPAMSALAALSSVAEKARGRRGAGLLNVLFRESSERAGDPSARALTARLSRAASEPYIRALEKWVYEGAVDDPYDEFLVVQRRDLRKESLAEEPDAAYWRERYRLRGEIPAFLSETFAEKALATGKYIDAARESLNERGGGVFPGDSSASRGGGARRFSLPPRREDGLGGFGVDAFDSSPRGSFERSGMGDRIADAHARASAELLRVLLDETHGDLKARLHFLKRYFLLRQGDFLVHFLDVAGEELARPAADVSVERLQSMLELSLKTSAASSDPHADHITCGLERRGILEHLLAIQSVSGSVAEDDQEVDRSEDGPSPPSLNGLTGMDAFTLEYRAPWPTSLVLSRAALTKYQLLFRHVFYCKHVERRLCAAWRAREAPRARGREGGVGLASRRVALQRMLHFTQNFTHYLTMEVIEPNWRAFESEMDRTTTVDALIAAHDGFLDACVKEGMLFSPKITRRLDVATKTCVRFADMIVQRGDREISPDGVGDGELADSTFESRLRALELEFDSRAAELLRVLNQSARAEPNVTSLCARLDFNEYYSYGLGGKH